MRRSRNVYLVGMMGAGKTTVGKKLARALGTEFHDLDRDIEIETGVSVATIFEIEGETGFRMREANMLALLAKKESIVVATGGGVVLDPLNRARLSCTGITIYLHAAPSLLHMRTKHDKSRPLLQVADPFGRIKLLTERRDPLYREIADIIIESGSGPGSAVSAILKHLDAEDDYPDRQTE